MDKGRLIITGAGGFLGSNLVRTACREGAFREVIAVTLGADEMKKRFEDVDGAAIYSENALSDKTVCLEKDDILINCAYPRAMKGSDIALGLDYVESVFQAAGRAGIKGIVNISSQSIYDPQRDHPASESDLPYLTDVYSVGKYCMEQLLRNVCRDIPHTNIRLASLIGPGFDVRVPNKMVKYALSTGQISVLVNQQNFGYLDVADAVNGLLKLVMTDPSGWESSYNLGSDRTYTLPEIAQTIREELKAMRGMEIEIAEKEGDAVLNSALDNSRIKGLIKDYQNYDLAGSIRRIIEALG